MNIILTSGAGSGPTELAAYDAALYEAGINHNVIYLSSIIPAGAKLVNKDGALPGEVGDRLYAVVSSMDAKVEGEEAWAGIGWVQDKKTGAGLFVEHHEKSESELKEKIGQSLDRLVEVRNEEYGPHEMLIKGIKCEGQPVSAIAAAVFKAEGWN